MRGLLVVLLLAAACRQEAPSEPVPGKDVPPLALRVAEKIGLKRWREAGRFRFTWRHARGVQRSYDWNVPGREVEVFEGTKQAGQLSRKIASDRPPEGDARRFHQMFVNDSYWLLFPLLILDDGATLRDLGEAIVPGMPKLGKTRALEVVYAPDEGYTGGDRYVLYIGADDLPVAWAFHKTGAKQPTLVTTRGPRRLANGVSLPTRFETPDGKLFIEISDVTIEPR